MDILLIVPDEARGALVKETGQLALSLVARKNTVHILSPKEKGSIFKGMVGVTIHHTPPTTWPWQHPQATQLKRCLKEHAYHAVHLVDMTPENAPLADVAIKANVPVVANMREAAHIDVLNTLSFVAKRRYRRTLDHTHQLIVSAPHILEVCENESLINTRLIPEGVDVSRFKPVLSKRPIRRELKLPESGTIACCVANIKDENKQLDALKMCEPLGELLHVVFVGRIEEPEYAAQLRAYIEKAGLTPYVTIREDLERPEDYLKASDVFILMGGIERRRHTILEAQSAGLPVVLAPSPSAIELTNANKCGVVLYEANALAKQGCEKLLTDPNYRQGRAVHTRPFVKTAYDFKNMIENYVQAYSQLS